ncbi:22324_t:CDS:2, partial [Gigaspora rosea]
MTGRDDWSFGLRFVVVAMNNSCDKPHGNCSLVNKLFANNIFDEEEIPDTIEILNDDETDLT